MANGCLKHGKRSRVAFPSKHAHVLPCIANEPESRLREMAHRVGITDCGPQRLSVGGGVSELAISERGVAAVDLLGLSLEPGEG